MGKLEGVLIPFQKQNCPFISTGFKRGEAPFPQDYPSPSMGEGRVRVKHNGYSPLTLILSRSGERKLILKGAGGDRLQNIVQGGGFINKKYKAVIFDLFGTLVDIFDQADYYSALREMMSILQLPHDDFIRLWRDTAERRATGVFRTLEENLEYICRELNEPVKSSNIKLARWARFDYLARALTPRQDAIEVLSQLKSDGYKTGLVSNCSTEPPVIWPHTSFAPFFDVTVFSSVAGIQKPDPRIYRIAADQLEVSPEDCLYIGDGDSHELTGAAGVGMHPVLIRVPHENSDSALRTSPKIDDCQCPRISSLREILDLVE